MIANTILLILALIFGLLAAVNVQSPPQLSYGWLGFSFFIASLLVGHIR